MILCARYRRADQGGLYAAAPEHPGRFRDPLRRTQACKGAQLVRSAGASVQLVAREGAYATIRLRSGEMRKVLVDCRATLGEVSNSEHSLKQLGKAGITLAR